MYAFVGVLSYSRWLYVEYVTSTESETLIACHRRMLQDFGGVPTEILYDNMRTVVTQRDAYGRGRHRFHDGIWALAGECGFRPRLCRPYRPQTKGKVERSVHYVANNFFHPLRTRLAMDDEQLDLARLNAEARLWCSGIANARVHATTKAVPRTRLIEEQAAMTPYRGPAAPAPISQWPRYQIQRSPKAYDAVLREVAR